MKKPLPLLLTLPSLLLFSTVLLPLGIAALTPSLAPYTAKFPGTHTLDQPGGEIPAMARAFAPFRETLGISWDEDFLYLEGDGLPDHPMMRGIVAWQQQVPLPQDFTGPNRFKLPLKPVVLEQPQELTQLGPIAIAVNGIPIFHSLTQSGKDAYAGGELDEWGGHCGRADDYHYHIAPAHLAEVVGKDAPVAFGLDGHPVYLENPEKDKALDECHGYFDESGNYRYVGNLTAPYMMAYFRGSAALEERPKTRPLRPALPPLRGAKITGFEGSLETGYSLKYEIDGRQGLVSYRLGADAVDFRFEEPDGRSTEKTYPLNGGGGKGGPPGGKGGKGGERRPPAPENAEATPPRSPWILVHAKEIDANGDGFVDLEGELMAEADVVFKAYDLNGDQHITPDESGEGTKMPRSALGGFVRQHATELDKDGDGGISKTEMTAQFSRGFTQADRDGDKRLSPEEYTVEGGVTPRFPGKMKPESGARP